MRCDLVGKNEQKLVRIRLHRSAYSNSTPRPVHASAYRLGIGDKHDEGCSFTLLLSIPIKLSFGMEKWHLHYALKFRMERPKIETSPKVSCIPSPRTIHIPWEYELVGLAFCSRQMASPKCPINAKSGKGKKESTALFSFSSIGQNLFRNLLVCF